MNFSAIPPNPWLPTTQAQKSKFTQLTSTSKTLPQTQITPTDANIPEPRADRYYGSAYPYNNTTNETTDNLAIKRRNTLTNQNKQDKQNTLDGFILLTSSNVDLPSNALRADISGRLLSSVSHDDLLYFNRLEYVDGNDNTLNLLDFINLKRLRELRLCCNALRGLDGLIGVLQNNNTSEVFGRLTHLDLSYNALTVSDVSNLRLLPALTDLDITYNILEYMPSPTYMSQFHTLKTLKAGHNSFETPSILTSLSNCPALVTLDLSYNYLQNIPKSVIDEFAYVMLETLDLSYNYVEDEESLLPSVLIEKLSRLIIVGNPICGATGEDITNNCVSRVTDAASEARDGWGGREFLVITTRGEERKVKGKGRRGKLYKDVKICKVEEENVPTGKAFRMAGRRRQEKRDKFEGYDHSQVQTPTTNLSRTSSRANDSGIANATFVTGIDAENEHDYYSSSDSDNAEPENSHIMPSSLLSHSLTKSHKNNATDPSKLTAAIHALRHALKGVDDTDMSSRINDGKTGVNRGNAAYRARALPKITFESKFSKQQQHRSLNGMSDSALRSITPGIVNAKLNAKIEGKGALHELEDILDNMNDRMEDIEASRSHGEHNEEQGQVRGRTAGMSSRSGDRAIGKLVEMVNVVVGEMG